MKRLGHGLACAAIVLIFTGFASAQTANPSLQPEPGTTINGHEHPEQISDPAAYGLVLSHFSRLLADPTVDRSIKDGLFLTIGLSPRDENIFREILTDHKNRRDAAIEAHKREVLDTADKGFPAVSFSPKHKAIVTETRTALLNRLSSDGLKKLDFFVQAEKKRMTVSSSIN